MISNPVVAPIVEGHGEVNAVRELITRIGVELSGVWVEVAQPFRLDSGKMRKPDELLKAVRVQAARVPPGRGGVLVLRDGDDNDVSCPIELAQEMALTSGEIRVPVEVVIAFHEYEAWFLAAVESLRGHSSMQDDAMQPADPEGKRDAKHQLEGLMRESYKETLHQAKFSALIDLNVAASNSRSFRRMVHVVQQLIGEG